MSRIRLRPLLQTMLDAIVIPAASIVAALVNFEARNALSDLPKSQFCSIAQGATAKIQEHHGNVPRGLSEIEFLKRNHDLNLDVAGDLKTHLLTQAVGYPTGTLIGYGARNGATYLLARREPKGPTILENVSREIVDEPGGSSTDEDYRESTWFKLGLA